MKPRSNNEIHSKSILSQWPFAKFDFIQEICLEILSMIDSCLWYGSVNLPHGAVLVVNYGISNTLCWRYHSLPLRQRWRPDDVCMRQWTESSLVQVMAWCRLGNKPLPDPMMNYCQWDDQGTNQWNLKQNTKIFFKDNESDNIVCKTSSILINPQWINMQWDQNINIHWMNKGTWININMFTWKRKNKKLKLSTSISIE